MFNYCQTSVLSFTNGGIFSGYQSLPALLLSGTPCRRPVLAPLAVNSSTSIHTSNKMLHLCSRKIFRHQPFRASLAEAVFKLLTAVFQPSWGSDVEGHHLSFFGVNHTLTPVCSMVLVSIQLCFTTIFFHLSAFLLLSLIFKKYHVCYSTIVRIEFSPLVWIGVNKRHYWPEETTDKGSTRVDARACAFLKLIIRRIFSESLPLKLSLYLVLLLLSLCAINLLRSIFICVSFYICM